MHFSNALQFKKSSTASNGTFYPNLKIPFNISDILVSITSDKHDSYKGDSMWNHWEKTWRSQNRFKLFGSHSEPKWRIMEYSFGHFWHIWPYFWPNHSFDEFLPLCINVLIVRPLSVKVICIMWIYNLIYIYELFFLRNNAFFGFWPFSGHFGRFGHFYDFQYAPPSNFFSGYL